MEAGNRCKDENHQIIINIVDITSDVNLCYSEHARVILDSRLDKNILLWIGSPTAEVLKGCLQQGSRESVLDELGLEARKYMLLSVHRERILILNQIFLSLMNAINILRYPSSISP